MKEVLAMAPPSLYHMSLQVLASKFHEFEPRFLWPHLTDSNRFDLYEGLQKKGAMRSLFSEISDVKTFLTLLTLGERQPQLHSMFQSVLNANFPLHDVLANKVKNEISLGEQQLHEDNSNQATRRLQLCVEFAAFLSDAGWHRHAVIVLEPVKRAIQSLRNCAQPCAPSHPDLNSLLFDCDIHLLHALSNDFQLEKAIELYETLVHSTISLNWSKKQQPLFFFNPSLLSRCYSEFASHCFSRSLYADAFSWSMEAVKHLSDTHHPKVIIDVLRQSSRSSVVRRQFSKAETLIQEAILFAQATYGEHHPKYADCLVDYGFYLLSIDSIDRSLQAYKQALKVRQRFFHGSNLRISLLNEDLAYASYVFNYNYGKFEEARQHSERALGILKQVLPHDHLLKASSQRVLALILEEIAIDETNNERSQKMLKHAEELHTSALELSSKAFGEMNVQTSKHYGNLGRLYQTMKKFTMAEKMHLKAIFIKEKILGPDDYEVALSIGHLASLYNYDMNEFEKAEDLYLRSIEIGEKLFGPSYSGLEYDFRGLIRIYESKNEAKNIEYRSKLSHWKLLRDQKKEETTQRTTLMAPGMPRPMNAIISNVMEDKKGSLGNFSDPRAKFVMLGGDSQDNVM